MQQAVFLRSDQGLDSTANQHRLGLSRPTAGWAICQAAETFVLSQALVDVVCVAVLFRCVHAVVQVVRSMVSRGTRSTEDSRYKQVPIIA